MFIRKKKNRSGTTSIIVVEKIRGKFKRLKTIGTSSDDCELDRLYLEAKSWIDNYQGGEDLFVDFNRQQEEKQALESFLSNIENILLNGTQLILNRVYDQIGFQELNDEILRHLVIARLSQPLSKAGTVEYLKSHFDEDIHLDKIYRYMDKLYNTQQEQVQKISVTHTKSILGGKIGLLFYDVTTLYFEANYGDGFREPGFSKDGKHSQPQIVLGLLVSQNGYPLSYSIFNGSQYEGRTMLPIVETFIHNYKLEDFVVVADSGLMNKKNIELLESQKYKYIIGARIKTTDKLTKKWILSLNKIDGEFNETAVEAGRLIIGYSEKRARKDAYNRAKGVKRLEKSYKSGTITKDHINRRGYNKFLELSNDVQVTISEDKIKEDEKWDGLKGYITNTDLTAAQVHEQYSGLWQVEKAFRVTKGTIEMRPMFHFTSKRIEAHVCICFVAYKTYKELERILKLRGIPLSVDKVLTIAKTVTTIKVRLPVSQKSMTQTMIITEKQKQIAPLFDENFWNFQDF